MSLKNKANSISTRNKALKNHLLSESDKKDKLVDAITTIINEGSNDVVTDDEPITAEREAIDSLEVPTSKEK